MFVYLIIYGAVLVLSVIGSRVMISLGPRWGLMDEPSSRRIHTRPVPRAGGLGIWLVFAISCVCLSLTGVAPLFSEDSPLPAFLAASAVLMLVGIVDDRSGMLPMVKLGGQLVAALLFWFLSDGDKGNIAGIDIPGWLDALIWVFWIILLVNAYNLIDGLDGLCGGLAWISLAGLLVAAVSLGVGGPGVLLVVIMMASVMGFLFFNRTPARLFLGDAGSMLLGLFIATVATELVGRRTVGAVVLLPVAVAGVPLFDVLLAVWRRIIKRFARKVRGEKAGGLFDADKEHLHHRLLARGWSQRRVAEVLQICAATVMLLCFLPLILGSEGWTLAIPLAFLLGVFLLRHTASVELIQSGNAIQMAFKKPGSDKRRRLTYMILDVILVLVAWLILFFIEQRMLKSSGGGAYLFSFTLAQVVGGVAALHLAGVYRTVWRRALVLEMATVWWILVTVASLLGLMVSLSDTPLSIWFLMKMSIGGAFLSGVFVLGPRGIAPLISQLALRSSQSDSSSPGKRILVYGAGDLGALYLDYLASRVRAETFSELVGFVDDDVRARGRTIRGFKILGAGENLENIVKSRRIDEVIVAIDDISPEFLTRLRDELQELEVDVRRWSVSLDPPE
jgi:UDP-GlcNAc:undecaprenyl-phosphate GlcNAc-1-phosphate transferase